MILFPSLKSPRWLLAITSLLFLFLFGVYTYIWFKQAEWLEHRIKHEITLLKTTQEITIDHDGLNVTGFPWKLEMRLDNPRLTSTNQEAVSLQIEGILKVKSALWSPKNFRINTRGRTNLLYTPAPHFAPLALKIENFQGSFKFHQNTFTLETLKFFNTQLKILENKINVKELTFSTSPKRKSVDESLIDSSVLPAQKKEVKNSVLNRSFALKISHLEINDYKTPQFPSLIESFEIIAHLEEPLNLRTKNPFKEWAQNGGFLEIEKFSFEWGFLAGKGNGTFALDRELQPLAAFSLNLSGLETFLDHLAQEKIIHKNVASIAKLSLGLLRDKSIAPEASRHTIALSLQKGDLSMGPLTVAKLPQMKWPSGT